MDELTVLLAQYGPYAVIAYLLIKDVFPKVFPEFAKAWNKRISTEDRLFKLLEKNSEAGVALASSLTKLETTLTNVNIAVQTLSQRVDRVEAAVQSANSVIAKFIKE